MHEVKHYPIYYYYKPGIKPKSTESDRGWVLYKMSFIPEDKQESIAREYEKIFRNQKNGRKAANTYLHNISKEYRLQYAKKQNKS